MKPKIIFIRDKDLDLYDIFAWAKEHDIEGVYLNYDFSDAEWKVNSKGKLKITSEYMKPILQQLYDKHGLEPILVLCFVHRRNWKNKEGLLGWDFDAGLPYDCGVVKASGNYVRVTFHELMHVIKDVIFIETGIKLADIFKVKDFDLDVVHGEDPRFKEYEYEQSYTTIKPYIHIAIQKRMARMAKISIIQQLIASYRQLLVLTSKKTEEIIEETMLEKWAKAIQEFEGWKVGSVSYRNNNPGNLRWSPTQAGTRGGFCFFNTFKDGMNALLHQLRIAATGKSQVYKPDDTLLEFFGKYAPSSDGNYPKTYAKFVANKLGVSMNTKIKDLV